MVDEFTIPEESDVQLLYEIIKDYFEFQDNPWLQLTMISKRFGIELEDGDYRSDGFFNYLYTMVSEINDSGKMFEFLTFMINEDETRLKRYQKILQKCSYDIDTDGDVYYVVPLGENFFKKESEELQTFIEQNAPVTTLSLLKKSQENFSKQRYDDALTSCRKALESLTKNGNFNDGVTELINEGLIIQGGAANRKNDAEVLRACYGYSSTLGAHAGTNTTPPDSEQALMGMFMTQSCIRFILKRVISSPKRSSLAEWNL